MALFTGTSNDDNYIGIAGDDTYQLGNGNDTITYNASIDGLGVLTWNNGFDTIISSDGGIAAPNYDRIVFSFSPDYIWGRKVGNNFELSIYAHTQNGDTDPGAVDQVGKVTLVDAFTGSSADRISRIETVGGFYFEAIASPVADIYGHTAIYKSYDPGTGDVQYDEWYSDINNQDTQHVTKFVNGYATVAYFDTSNNQPWTRIAFTYSNFGLGNQTLEQTIQSNDNGAYTITGGAGNDTLGGGNGNDSVLGGAGNDSVYGNQGNDTLLGQGGNDTVFGGEGDDVLGGLDGADYLDGEWGDDTIYGYSGGDTLVGGLGFDQVNYSQAIGAVTVNLGTSVGLVNGGGTDLLSGIEDVTGSLFNDTLIGSTGDNYFASLAGNDSIDGGAGTFDTIDYYDATAGLTVVMSAGSGTINAGNGIDTFLNIENIYGSNFGDSITGDSGNNRLRGRLGNDTLNGGAGTDEADYAFTGSTGSVNVSLVSNTAVGGAGNDTLISIESVRGSEFNDAIEGSDSANRLQGRSGNDLITGLGGNDTLDGGTGDDTLIGGAGADSLYGFAGNDIIDGGVSVDHYFGSDSNSTDYLYATAGVNVNLSGIMGDGSIGFGTVSGDASVGVDTISNISSFRGSNFNDTIIGSTALIFESFDGGVGNDSLDGGAITDTLNGDDGNRVSYRNTTGAGVTVDLIAGTAVGSLGSDAGTDTIANFNQVQGSSFNDFLYGSDQSDTTEFYEGRDGNDYIDGRGGFDQARYDNATGGIVGSLITGTVTGAGVGTDTLVNVEGLRGSAFDDLLIGGNAANGVVIGDGLSESFRGNAGNDTIDGGQGYDTANYGGSTSGINVILNDTLDGSASDGMGGTDVLRNIEAVSGSFFNDTLTGSNTAGFESFEGREGNDIIDGFGGTDRADYRFARAGVTVNLTTGQASDGYGGTDTLLNIENVRGSRDFSDAITGNAAANKLEGLGGNDTLEGGAGADSLDGGEGTDTVSYAGASSGITANLQVGLGIDDGSLFDTYVSIENVMGSAYDDVIVGLAGIANRLEGGVGNDTFYGEGVDTVIGGNGLDTYFGGQGSALNLDLAAVSLETVWGSYVGDVMNGATSSANLVLVGQGLFGGANADTMTGGTGNDFIYYRAGDAITGGAGSDWAVATLSGSGVSLNLNTAGFENAWGSTSDDLLSGAGASTTVVIVGDTGNDTITGGNATDFLYGFAGNDVLTGGAGGDVLLGGDGNDLFVYTTPTGSGFDSLFDFVSGADKFQFTAASFGLSAGATLTNGVNFISGGTPVAGAATPTVLYNTGTGIMSFDADGSGGGAAVSLVQLSGAPALAASDFVFV